MGLKQLFMMMIAALALALSGTAVADNSLPQVTHDGLHLVKHTKVRALWMKPGANLDNYSEVALLKCYVAFNKNWKRDYNEETVDLANMITDQDMQKIRDKLSEEFNKVFTEVLTQAGHKMVTQGGSGVLILRPAIVNLEVTSPDTMAPNMDQSFSADAGQMTLYMEMYDGKTGDIIARVIAPEALGDGMWQVRNSVTNLADADRLLRRWATALSDHVATVKVMASTAASN